MDFKSAREEIVKYTASLIKDVPYELGEAVRHACINPGKLLRPLVTLAVAHDYGISREIALPYAVASQLAHDASLVFDDRMDGSTERRGLPSVFTKFNEHTDTLTGIYLLKLGQRILTTGSASDSVKNRLVNLDACTGLEACLGQWMDLHPESVNATNLKSFYNLKTGVLIGAAAECGGILGNASEEDLKVLKTGMSCVGVAYQIGDDLADVFGTPEELGKPVGQDKGKVNSISLFGVEQSRKIKRDFDARADELLFTIKTPLPSLRAMINELRAKYERYMSG